MTNRIHFWWFVSACYAPYNDVYIYLLMIKCVTLDTSFQFGIHAMNMESELHTLWDGLQSQVLQVV